MAKNKKSSSTGGMEGVFLLKILLYMLLGSMWLKLSNGGSVSIGLPVGFIVGLIFTSHDHFQIDRKIEYAILLIAMLFGYFASYGLYVNY
jgi:inner membrane protein involved in colicin E2 resistance